MAVMTVPVCNKTSASSQQRQSMAAAAAAAAAVKKEERRKKKPQNNTVQVHLKESSEVKRWCAWVTLKSKEI